MGQHRRQGSKDLVTSDMALHLCAVRVGQSGFLGFHGLTFEIEGRKSTLQTMTELIFKLDAASVEASLLCVEQ